jgi:uncharacterized membrane protein
MIRKLWTVRSRLPERVATHWGLHGQVNGWSSRTMVVILLPALALVMAGVLSIAPRLDPKRRNFPLHADAYWVVTNAILGLLALTHVATIGYNLGWPMNLATVVGVGVGVLFIVLGNLLSRVRPNWIFGIRTPWTLSSDRAWRETHRVGGYGFVLVGLLIFLTALVQPSMVYQLLAVGIFAVVMFSVVWSYFAWKRDPDALGRDA